MKTCAHRHILNVYECMTGVYIAGEFKSRASVPVQYIRQSRRQVSLVNASRYDIVIAPSSYTKYDMRSDIIDTTRIGL